MGISHLVPFVRPYATRLEVPLARAHAEVQSFHEQCHDTEASGSQDKTLLSTNQGPERLIIDGPGLAYHVYYKALARRIHCRNALDAIPSYEEVTAIAIEWLETIQKYTFKLDAIYFDGALPHYKRQERVERLGSYLSQLSSFRNLYPSHVELTTHDRSIRPSHSASLFSISPVPTKLSALPALPFLVPAVIEALCQSSFRDITYVVPGEADTFCANHVRRHGGTVLTSDSDLLIHNLGANGCVIFFKDLEGVATGDVLRLTGTRYDVTVISHRLNLKTLIPLAFAVQRDHHRGFNNCLLEAKLIQDSEDVEYKQFSARYLDDTVTLPSAASETPPAARVTLDPRVSEWLHQPHHLPREVAQIPQSQQQDFYLPFLIEDPTRISSWTPSLPIRQLAYSAMRPSSSSFQYLTAEHFRRGPRIAQTCIEHLPAATVNAAADTWREELENLDLVRLGGEHGWGVAWRVIGVYQVCRYLAGDGKAVPGRYVMEALICGDLVRMEWEFVHWSAMVQGVVYSWRVLGQLLALAEVESERWQALYGLLALVGTLPGIVELFPARPVVMDEVGMKEILDRVYGLLDLQEDSTVVPVAGQFRKRKRKKRDGKPKAKEASSSARISSTNMYSILSDNE